MRIKFIFLLFPVFILLLLLFLSGYIKKEKVSPPTPESKEQLLSLEKSHFSGVGKVQKANWIRFWILWENVEKERGKYDFSFVDDTVKKFQKNNRVLLFTVLPFASWDQNVCHGEEYFSTIPVPWGQVRVKVGKPCNMTAYAEFLSRLVERYDGDGTNDMPGLRYPVKYWEIMNEPAMQGDLRFFSGSPEDYLEILKVSYERIKQSDKGAKVLMAGMAGMQSQFVQFWDKIMSEAKNYFDIANIHSISTTSEMEDLFLFKFKEFLKNHGAENKKIWITEVQYGDLFSPPKDLRSVEKLLVKSTVFALANGASKIFHVGNWHEFWKSETMQRVYEILVSKIDYFDKVEILKQEYEKTKEGIKTKIGQYKFVIGNKTVFVLWGNVKLPEEIKGKVKVTDIYGNEKIIQASEITLSNEPIYVEIEELKEGEKQETEELNFCEDGTPYDQCSTTKPFFCENGRLVEKCWKCGCSEGVCVGRCEYEGAQPKEEELKIFRKYQGKCLSSVAEFEELFGKVRKEEPKEGSIPGIKMYISDDGINWKEIGTIIEGVGVPDFEILDNGKMIFYHVGKSLCSVSSDGYNWEDGNCSINGLRSLELLDPEVVKIGSNHYRMYFFGGNMCPMGSEENSYNPVHVIYLATSNDGIHWEVEDEAIKDIGLMDPEVKRMEKDWIMCMNQIKNGKIQPAVAYSPDGMKFSFGKYSAGDCIYVDEYREIKIGKKILRYPCSEDGKIKIISSENGSQWKEIGKLELPCRDVYLIQLPDGKYAMYVLS